MYAVVVLVVLVVLVVVVVVVAVAVVVDVAVVVVVVVVAEIWVVVEVLVVVPAVDDDFASDERSIFKLLLLPMNVVDEGPIMKGILDKLILREYSTSYFYSQKFVYHIMISNLYRTWTYGLCFFCIWI